ncbi:MAG: HAD family hydrolase [Candidatus Aminicenantes bacterium]|jgi:FMN phosphatase YigB (HAD superfamily)
MTKIIFWDWTGTLADEARLDKAVCRSLEKDIAAKRNIAREEAARLFNNHLRAIENSWKWHDYVQHSIRFGIDWRHSQEINLDKLVLVPHAREILEYARAEGYRNILVTNAVRDVVLLRTKHVGIIDMFEAIIASSDVKSLKEEGKHFTQGLKEFYGDPHRSWSVGDNPIQDIQPAKRLGLKTIFCDFGERLVHYHSEHISNNHREVSGADYTIKNLQEIEKII